MNNIYIITFKKDNLKRAYTTLTAITEAHSSEETGISKNYLERKAVISGYYENSRIIIEKLKLQTRNDVIRERKENEGI